MKLLDSKNSAFLYEQVINFIHEQREDGQLRPGDKLPSLRKLGQQLNISVPTVKQAYVELERQGFVSARPQSGYYLKAQLARALKPWRRNWSAVKPAKVTCRSVIESVYEAVHLTETVPLGISNPINAHPPDKMLARLMRGVISKVADKAVSYGPVNGDAKLRAQLAFRYQEQGTKVDPNDLIITNGAQDAMAIALQCVAKTGDIIAIESPTFFGIIELIESLGMRALEIYTCAEDGVCPLELEKAIGKHAVSACLFSTAVNNPLGSYMPESNREKIVTLLEKNNIPLVEDDVYSDIYFTEKAPKSFQHYSQKGLVLTCSSFSKTAAPGYRVGWLVASRFEEQAKRLKRARSASTAMLQQWTLTEYLTTGEYDRHLVVLRKVLSYNCERMRACIAEHFPPETCISAPQGGSVLWLRCRSHIHTEQFFDEALAQGVSFAPGIIFSPSGKFHNYMRVSYGVKWGEDVENAIKILGKLVHEQ